MGITDITLRKMECTKKCVVEIPGFHPIQHQRCISECVKGGGNGVEEDTRPKKEITIVQQIEQTQYQYQYQLGVETQAPFTYAPVTEKVYSPIFQLYSPQAVAGIETTQEATSKIDLLLAQWQDFLAKQAAEQTAGQEATATISEEEKTAQSLLGAVILAGGIGALGYWGYKEYKKGGLKKKK